MVALVGCDAAKGETCRETPCADGAVRGAFTEALCAALRAREQGSKRIQAEDTVSGECTPVSEVYEKCHSLHLAARDAKALAAAAAAAARDRRETAFAVEKCGARAQTPIAVVAYEGAERDGGLGWRGT